MYLYNLERVNRLVKQRTRLLERIDVIEKWREDDTSGIQLIVGRGVTADKFKPVLDHDLLDGQEGEAMPVMDAAQHLLRERVKLIESDLIECGVESKEFT